ESFSADGVSITFHGFNTHPGYAKGKMVNAIKVAASFIESLPQHTLSPETTEGMEGFVHPNVVQASVETTTVKLIVRDFDTYGLQEKERMLEALALQATHRHPGSRMEFTVVEQYRNMKQVLDTMPQIADYAEEAVRRAGLEVRRRSIRGGTDGSRLSFMGLPTPNIFAGEHNFHSRLEWVSVQDMEKAVAVIVNLARVWEERT
ncbi:MAG: M20/M25/M40 family metallo-hydrolase, partial [Ilumatobacteraceae bacterium]